MNKATKKRQKYNAYNVDVIKALSEEYEVSPQFVRQAIRKDRTSLTAETIRKRYFQLTEPTTKAIEEFKANPVN